MLREIRCSEFKKPNGEPRPAIIFNDGLNTVMGGTAANNSIGKSTFMLIIDFCFGGDTYAKADVKNHVGDHTICFAFEFEDGMHYYSRSVLLPKKINICNENYEPLKTIKDKEFREELMRLYGMELPEAGFREVVGRFFRIAGKKNDTISHPLNDGSPKDADAIDALEKLFNLYRFVGELKKHYKEVSKKKSTYTSARTLELVPSAIKTDKQLAKNDAEIALLEKELAELTQDTDKQMLEEEMRRNEESAKLDSQMRGLKRQYRRLNSQYRIVTKNREAGFIATEDDFSRLQAFFPGIDIKKLQEVEKFHRSLHGILSEEMTDEAESLQVLIKDVEVEIQRLEARLEELGVTLQVPQQFLDKYSNLQRRISELKAQNESYIKNQEFKDDVDVTDKRLDVDEMQVLSQIEAKINSQMARYNDLIYEDERDAPVLRFTTRKKIEFITPDDDGTGTAYKSLCILDLSILKITPLPAMAHDSSIFKNIGDEPIDSLIDLYSKSDKQIFIAFDKVTAYSDATRKILEDTTVLTLGDNDELFGWSWAKKKNKGKKK